MNQELIVRLAKQSGIDLYFLGRDGYGASDPIIANFAALVAEECAKICDERRHDTIVLTSMPPQSSAAYSAAQKIRATFK